MRRIKLGKGLLRSLFPSNSSSSNISKKKSSSKKNKFSSSAAGAASNIDVNNNGSAFSCPTILGAGRRKNSQHPYELHQEGESSPPSSDDDSRGHEDAIDGTSVCECEKETEFELQGDDVRREANVSSPIALARTLSEEQDEEQDGRNKLVVTDNFEAGRKVEAPVEQQQEANEHTVHQLNQQDESFDTALDHLAYFATSPSREEARRRAIARQQRILSQASTRFQALSETATIDTSGYSYSSPPHLQRRRWQQHLGRQTRPHVAVADMNDANPQVSSSCIRHSKQQRNQTNKNCSSVIFYDATPTRDLPIIDNSELRHGTKQKEGKFSSPTCVADMVDYFEVSIRDDCNKSARTRNPIISSSNNSSCMSTSTESNIHFFILLLCPQSRIFEVIEVSDAPLHSTVGDVLKLIPQHITDERLLKKKYTGLCRPADRTEFIDLGSPAFLRNERQGEDCIPFDYIHESDVLVAILNGSTCYQMSKISKPILRNPKFKEMIRRRRRRTAADKASRKKKRKSKKKHTEELNSPTNEIYVPDDCTVVSGITCVKPLYRSKESQRVDDPTSLRNMLETLSRKLHEVEEVEVFSPDGDDSVGSRSKHLGVNSGLDQVKRRYTAETSPQEMQNIEFKMSPKMLAMELAQTIEDIFADNNVEIVAVDADDNDESEVTIEKYDDDDDNDTFVSARSHRTKSTVGTLKSTKFQSPTIPLNKISQDNKTKTISRQFKFAETMEDNALAAQIEAMAAQADAAFEDRNKKNSSRCAAVIDNTNDSNDVMVTEAVVTSKEASSTEVGCITHDVDESFETTFESLLNSEDTEGATKETNRARKDANARKFFNASTSTVSTMVAANQGRVNEVHVLDSLGCTIVCIAANYMQLTRQSDRSPSIKTSEAFQSATFLAFIVSGERYLAKLTQK